MFSLCIIRIGTRLLLLILCFVALQHYLGLCESGLFSYPLFPGQAS